jgi:tRNA G18 (ribose-2'-O)-methylase SpoU
MYSMRNDTRNVVDEFKGKSEADIVKALDKNDVELHIAIENLERDFNMGTIVRSANAFGVRHVHILGSKQWNKRGAMATDKYLHVHYHTTVGRFLELMKQQKRAVVAIDNVEGSIELNSLADKPQRVVLIFGSEKSGISSELLSRADAVVAIEQKGSTRSINVGVAAGIAMYTWLH